MLFWEQIRIAGVIWDYQFKLRPFLAMKALLAARNLEHANVNKLIKSTTNSDSAFIKLQEILDQTRSEVEIPFLAFIAPDHQLINWKIWDPIILPGKRNSDTAITQGSLGKTAEFESYLMDGQTSSSLSKNTNGSSLNPNLLRLFLGGLENWEEKSSKNTIPFLEQTPQYCWNLLNSFKKKSWH